MAATNYDYISSGNNADNVRLIKDYALFLYGPGETYTKPESVDWKPAAGKNPIGYNSEDGATLHPEPGDTTEIKGHNGDVTVSETDPGYWTLQVPGLECRKDIAEAYFGVTADEKGALHVKDATTPTMWGFVLAGLDQHGDPIMVCAEKAQVSDRDDISLVSTSAVVLNVTFKMLKGSDGYMFHAYGLISDAASTASADAEA